ncbi:hypothetical protein F5144DRAFT_632098 [Chaetomium tenue]|uniref:Uncharacterized protein n=1 Tax=Chaetomium tenue TaxID=1854479 RepID=A0ACB7P1X3_9PEZI|nr:hypothetical protein F5144DRAFT_632098 [Chaetomium globosum]
MSSNKPPTTPPGPKGPERKNRREAQSSPPKAPQKSSPGSGETMVLPVRQSPSRQPSSGSQGTQGTQRTPPKALLPAIELQGRSGPNPKESTLLEAFYEPLPSVTKAADFGHGDTRPSGTLVAETNPPQCWVPLDVNHYLAIAETHLSKDAIKKVLSAHRAPALDPTFRVRREDDIVTYAATHLTHAVNHALGAILSQPVEMLNEYSASTAARVDRAWRPWGAKKHSFAVLEMKNMEAMRALHFEATQDEDPDADTPSLFDGRPILSMIKQITCYVKLPFYDTRYASLYDGNFLFLGVFELPPQQDSLPILKGTLIPCHGKHNDKARRALLGWLVEAWEKKQRGENHHLRLN